MGTLGRMIGQGRTAVVHEWDEGKVLKLFRPAFERSWIEREYQTARGVYEAGVPSPEPYEVVELEQGVGIVYERAQGVSLFDLMQKAPWKMKACTRKLARLHVRMHASRCDRIGKQSEALPGRIRYSQDLLGAKLERILRYTERLPEGSAVLHGDFHPGNVMESGGELKVLDWTNAEAGNPAADVARTLLMLQSPYMPPGTGKLIARLSVPFKRRMEKIYLQEYLRTSGMTLPEIEAWQLPVAAARLIEGVPGERDWLLALIDEKLKTVKE